MQQPEPQKRIAAKPSLLSPSTQNDTENIRILSSASHGGTPPAASSPARRRFGVVAIVFGLIALAVAATLISRPDNTLEALNPVAASVQSAPTAVADPASAGTPPQTITSPAVAGNSGLPAAPQAATIVTDESPSAAEQAAIAKIDGQDKLTTALEAGVKPQPAALQTALDASSSPVKAKPVVHAPLVNRVAPAKAAEPAANPDKQAANQSRNQVDNDVNLITALVTHSTEREQKQAAKDAVPLPKPQKLAQSNKGTSKTSTKAANRNQDIVERQISDSTESLLQRCSSLGFIEGELCRWRICSGRWDADAACKVK